MATSSIVAPSRWRQASSCNSTTLEVIRAEMLRYPQTSRTYRVLKARRDALALAYGYCSAVLRAGAL
jgi:hypothetical protein